MRRIYATRVRTSTATYGGQIDGGRRRHVRRRKWLSSSRSRPLILRWAPPLSPRSQSRRSLSLSRAHHYPLWAPPGLTPSSHPGRPLLIGRTRSSGRRGQRERGNLLRPPDRMLTCAHYTCRCDQQKNGEPPCVV